MKKMRNYVGKHWAILFVGCLLILQAAVFLIFRENSYLAVHDNLDLFVAHLQILKNTDTFFAQDTVLPMLGGVSRNTFGSEFSLYNILYFVFPNFPAYMIGYALKIAMGIFSFCLLAKDIYKEKYETYRPLVLVIGLAFGLIPVFPAYGIAFTSVPVIVYLLRRIYLKPEKWLFVGVFLYPLISYFSYFGFFILAYIVLAVIVLWIKDKRFPKWIFLSCIVLALGYMCFEYRLFKEMLFGDTITIRTTMLDANLGFIENVKSIFDVFVNTIFHAQDSHKFFVMPVCLIGLVIINLGYIRRKETKKILADSCNLTFFFIVFNVLIYGTYNWGAFRNLVFTLVPPLTGFQFNRTYYFNPFLWYALLFLMVKRLYDFSDRKESGNLETSVKLPFLNGKRIRYAANGIAMIAAIIVMFAPQTYNDFYSTCYYNAYSILKGTPAKDLNYREFYSKDLFEDIKEEIGYNGEWSVAYGMHPAVLEYNDIATLDGYLGLYEQEYKEQFREIIAPALETADYYRSYYDDWGARAYLFSASDEGTYTPYRELELKDKRLAIDTEAFQRLGGKYIFSRIEISNREELGLNLKGVYTADTSPYTIYLYEAE